MGGKKVNQIKECRKKKIKISVVNRKHKVVRNESEHIRTVINIKGSKSSKSQNEIS